MPYLSRLFLRPAHGIINGKESDLTGDVLAKHVVALQMREVQPDGSVKYYKGSAAIIDSNILITAGHNAAYIPDPNDIEVIFSYNELI